MKLVLFTLLTVNSLTSFAAEIFHLNSYQGSALTMETTVKAESESDGTPLYAPMCTYTSQLWRDENDPKESEEPIVGPLQHGNNGIHGISEATQLDANTYIGAPLSLLRPTRTQFKEDLKNKYLDIRLWCLGKKPSYAGVEDFRLHPIFPAKLTITVTLIDVETHLQVGSFSESYSVTDNKLIQTQAPVIHFVE